MKRILVPTDFSLPSLSAYKFALQLSGKMDAEIFVAHVIELPLLQETAFGIQPLVSDPEFLRQMKQRVQEAFSRLITRYPTDRQVHFHSLEGEVINSLRSFIDDNKVDLVIMAPRGQSDLDDFFTGSTAVRFVRYSPVPVLFISEEIPIDSIQHIVFPSTLPLDENDLVDAVKDLQRIFHAKLHILFVNTPLHFKSDHESRELLERFASHYHITNYTLNCRNHQHESHAIATFVDETPGVMLAMSTHGRKGIVHLIKGSIAESMVSALTSPVWVRKSKIEKT